jgi:hypothetical protein
MLLISKKLDVLLSSISLYFSHASPRRNLNVAASVQTASGMSNLRLRPQNYGLDMIVCKEEWLFTNQASSKSYRLCLFHIVREDGDGRLISSRSRTVQITTKSTTLSETNGH